MKRLLTIFVLACSTVNMWGQFYNADELLREAESGNVYSQIKLAICYYEGQGVAKDYGKAVELFRQVENQKEGAAAFYWLGLCYENGHGVKKNLVRAKEYYEKAIEEQSRMARGRLEVVNGQLLDQLRELYK